MKTYTTFQRGFLIQVRLDVSTTNTQNPAVEGIFDFCAPSSLSLDFQFHVPIWVYLCPFIFPHYPNILLKYLILSNFKFFFLINNPGPGTTQFSPGENKHQHTDNKSCFESAPHKSRLFNVHNEAIFLVISFNCTQVKGSYFQHTLAPRKPNCRGAAWPPAHLQAGCSPATVQMRPDRTHCGS